MYASKLSLLALALPVALLTACGDDGTTETGADETTAAEPTTTGEEPTTTGETPTTTGEEPTTTGEEPTTTVDPDTTTGEPVENAEIRVLHLGVGAPGVDVFANGTGPVVTNLEFRNGTDYVEVPAGEYTFDVSVTGTPVEEAVISAGPLALDANTSYSAVAIGDIEGAGDTALQIIALVDDAADIAATDVRITVIHAAPAVGQVDIWEISDPAAPVALLEDVDYGVNATLPDIPAGPLEIGIDVDNDAEPDLTFSVDVTPLAGAQLNVFANNDAEGGVALVAQLPDGSVLAIDPN